MSRWLRTRLFRCPRLAVDLLEDRLAPSVSVVRDIVVTAETSGSDPASFVQVGTTTYFAANSPNHGRELWKTDGTSSGTVLVRDIRPGIYGSDPANLTAIGSLLYFSANNGDTGAELWRSNGTSTGTVLVRDIQPGFFSSSPDNFVNSAGVLVFTANDGTSGTELWSMIGGTPTLLEDIYSGATGSNPAELTAVGLRVFFRASDAFDGAELWATDTNLTTADQVFDIRPGSNGSFPESLTNVNSTLYFAANDGVTGAELWRSNGSSSGTSLIEDLRAGAFGSSPDQLVNGSGILYFSAFVDASGRELHRSLGTAASTFLISEIAAGTASSTPTNLTMVGTTLYFAASNGSGNLLWKSEGASSSTVLVEDHSDSPAFLTNVGGILYFVAEDILAGQGRELWKSEGADSTTSIVEDILPGAASSAPAGLANGSGALYFSATNAAASTELWRSTGPSSTATDLVRDIYTGNSSAFADNFTNLNGTLFFTADDTDGPGNDLWKSNGTSSGTVFVLDLDANAGVGISDYHLTNHNGLLYFTASDGANGFELWTSNGISTALLKDINAGAGHSLPRDFIPFNGFLYFSANTSANGRELWRTDGTSSGTTLVADLNPGAGGSYPAQFTVVGNELFFTAGKPDSGVELWKTNGTGTGTALVRDINPFADSSAPGSLVNFNSTLFFFANDGVNGPELWKSNGTASGTTLVRTIFPGIIPGPAPLVAGVDGVYFRANDDAHGSELWRSDGTSSGTVLAHDINPGIGSSDPLVIVRVGDRIHFTAFDSVLGREFWTIDPDGTISVEDIRPGSGSSTPGNLTNINGALYFTANDGVNGFELWWAADDDAVLFEHIIPGSGDAFPAGYFEAGGVLYFTALSPTVGRELHRLDGGLPPRITSNGGESSDTFLFPENQTLVTTVTAVDPNGGPLTYSVSGGFDAARFAIDSATGKLTFAAPPDFENPIDHNFNNVYNVIVRVSDGVLFDDQILGVNLSDRAHDQSVVYVDAGLAGKADGTVIADIDPFTGGSQAGVVGVNAFAALEPGVDAVAAGGKVTIFAGTYAGKATFNVPFSLNTPGGTVTVSGVLSGTAGLRKTGVGTLALTGANSFTGGVALDRGTVSVAADAALGNVANDIEIGSLASLRVTGSFTTSRAFALDEGTLYLNPGTVLTLDFGDIGGGTLAGDGILRTTPAGFSYLRGLDVMASASVDLLGNDAAEFITNNGLWTTATGKTVDLHGFVNNPAGRVTLNGTTTVSSFSTIGQLTVAGTVNNMGFAGMVFGGGSLTTITGTGKIDIGANADALMTNAYAKNNGAFGSMSKTIVVDFGGFFEGNKSFGSVLTQNGGLYAPGNSPGPADTNQFNINGGGRLEFEITNASGTAGALSGWDLVRVQPTVFSPGGLLNLTATSLNKYTLLLNSRQDSGDGNAPGDTANFNSALPYTWKFCDFTHPMTGFSGLFDPGSFAIETKGFSNAFTGGFSVQLTDNDKSLSIIYTPTAGPIVAGISVNNNLPQRSRLTTIKVNFQAPVEAGTLTGFGAIQLKRTTATGGGTVGTVVQTGAPGANGRILVAPASGMVSSITLTFDNANGAAISAGVESGSLSDGRWQLLIPTANYASPLNDPDLRRLFGDSNSDGTVDGNDLAAFGSAFGQTLQNSPFDFNHDGTVDALDFGEFGNRFGMTL